MDRGHRALLVVGALHPETRHDIAAWTGVRLRDILLASVGRSRSRKGLFLSRIAVAWLPFVVTGILKLLLGTLRDPKQVGSPLAQESFIESVAQRTLAFSDGTLDFTLPDSAEDDLLSLVRQLLGAHAAEVQFDFRGRKAAFHLGEP